MPASRRWCSSSRARASSAGSAPAVERRAAVRQTQAGLLLRRLQEVSRRIVAIQATTQSASAVSAAALSSGLDVQLLELPKWRSQASISDGPSRSTSASACSRRCAVRPRPVARRGVGGAGRGRLRPRSARRDAAATPRSVRADRDEGCEARRRPCRSRLRPPARSASEIASGLSPCGVRPAARSAWVALS